MKKTTLLTLTTLALLATTSNTMAFSGEVAQNVPCVQKAMVDFKEAPMGYEEKDASNKALFNGGSCTLSITTTIITCDTMLFDGEVITLESYSAMPRETKEGLFSAIAADDLFGTSLVKRDCK